MTLIRVMFFFTAIGLAATFPCLVKTTPLTMMAFAMLGMPSFGLAILAYGVLGFRLLKAKFSRNW
jgi:hypothetical protein